jgi:hypothetical protein
MACSKPDDDRELAKYMEDLSKNYFSQIFPNSTIFIESKPKAGKQGGHVVVVDSNTASSTVTTIKVIYKYN